MDTIDNKPHIQTNLLLTIITVCLLLILVRFHLNSEKLQQEQLIVEDHLRFKEWYEKDQDARRKKYKTVGSITREELNPKYLQQIREMKAQSSRPSHHSKYRENAMSTLPEEYRDSDGSTIQQLYMPEYRGPSNGAI